MARGFVKTALSNPPEGLCDIVDWLYRARSGPRLLDCIIDECQNLLREPTISQPDDFLESESALFDKDSCATGESWAGLTSRLSAGALVLLKRHIVWLVEHRNKESNVASTGLMELGDTGEVRTEMKQASCGVVGG